MQSKPRLGIIDWGIGGIGLARMIRSHLDGLRFFYLSDTGATPYGRMSRRELVSRLQTVIAFLKSQGVTHLAVACNAASTALPFLPAVEMKVEGMIDSAVTAAQRMRPRRLALIGGRRTVMSGVYRRAFADRGIHLDQRIAQPLSALIESGDVSSLELREQCRTILSPIRGCSHLLLACTHYPAVTPILEQYVSSETIIIDPAAELAARIKRWNLPPGGTDGFCTTGAPEKMKSAAWNAFRVKIGTVQTTTI